MDTGSGLRLIIPLASGEGRQKVGYTAAPGVDVWQMILPTELDCSCLPSVPTVPFCSLLSNVDTTSDGGLEREEVRVSPTARGALRPQPTDGLWQPPSSKVEPLSERVEEDKGTLGEIDIVRAPLLSPVVEASIPDEELTLESCIGVDLKLAPSPLPGVSVLHDSCCPVAVSEKPGLMEMVGGVGSQGEAAMAVDSGSGSLLTDDSPLSPIGMVSSSPSPVLDDRRILAAASVDVPVIVADSLVVVEDSHVVKVVDRPVEVVDCRPMEVVDNHLVVADCPMEEIVGRPAVNKVNSPVAVVDVAAVVGQGVPVLGGDLGDCGGHEERRQ
ncbi:hypothetical protein Dimus_013519 [Dionaea muscipula]